MPLSLDTRKLLAVRTPTSDPSSEATSPNSTSPGSSKHELDRRHSDSSKYAARVRAEQQAAASAKGPVVVRSRKGGGAGGGGGGGGGSKGGSGGDISGSQRLSLGSNRNP